MLSNLTRIVKAQYAAKLGKNIDDIKDLPLEDMHFSDLESSDGGSDSSVSDGPPKLPMLRKVPVISRTTMCLTLRIFFKGAGGGGPRSIFTFFIFVNRWKCQLPGTFFGMEKNIVPSQSYCTFESQKYIQLHCVGEL